MLGQTHQSSSSVMSLLCSAVFSSLLSASSWTVVLCALTVLAFDFILCSVLNKKKKQLITVKFKKTLTFVVSFNDVDECHILSL